MVEKLIRIRVNDPAWNEIKMLISKYYIKDIPQEFVNLSNPQISIFLLKIIRLDLKNNSKNNSHKIREETKDRPSFTREY